MSPPNIGSMSDIGSMPNIVLIMADQLTAFTTGAI